MSLNGKRKDFEVDDLVTFAAVGGLKKARAKTIVAEISAVLAEWPQHASAAEIPKKEINQIAKAHRKDLFQ